LIRLESVGFGYEKSLILEDISLSIAQNERVVLLGNNGCGKSTLLKILAGLLYPKKGRYLYNEAEITKRYLKKENKRFRQEVAILFQTPETMFFNPTVYEEIAFSLEEFEIDKSVEEIAKEFEIEHLLEKSPLKLSGGEKQKVAFAVIFATEPKLLLLDEPTANLDPRTTGWFIDFLLQKQVTTIIATHNLSLAYELGDRAIAMNEEHRIIFDGDIEVLFANKELLLEANLIHKHKHRHKTLSHSHFHMHDWD